jgi:Uma2 family endonuclease
MKGITATRPEKVKAAPSSFFFDRIRRFSVKEYHWMGEVGILQPDERTELIDGVIRKMSPRGSKHAATVSRLANLLPHLIKGKAWIRVQDPIVLDDNTEPEPDISIVALRDDAYATAHPRPEDVLLVIEVADTTLEDDRTVKLPRYAKAGIPEVWLIDVADAALSAYRQPVSPPDGASTYRVRVDYFPGDAISPVAFPEVEIAINQILIPEL